MSLIRIDPERLRGLAEKVRRDANHLAPRPYANGGILRHTINGESFIPVERACSLVVSTQPPADPKPGDRWIDSVTGEQHVFRPFGGITGEEAAVAIKAALGGCPHTNPEPVILTTDEVVAAVCPDCLQPLPPSYVGSDWRP